MPDLILCEEQEAIATLTINRPEKHNALSPDMLALCCAHLDRLQAAAQTRVLVIRGHGTRAFTSGFDIGRLPDRQGQSATPVSTGPGQFAQFIAQVRAFPAPTIAMIHGYCMGGGLELAATCDIRLSATTGQFRMPPARLGVLYSGEGLLRFINLIGIAHTSEIFYTACTFDATRAREMGLLNHVLPPDELEPATYVMARHVANNAPLSVQYTKRVLGMIQGLQDLSPHAEAIQRLRDVCMHSDDLQEGRRAFLDKRAPVFQGR